MKSRGFQCIVCGSTDCTPTLEQCRDLYLGHPLAVDYFRCSKCALVQQSPLPDDIGRLYADYPIHMVKSSAHRWIRRILLRKAYFDFRALAPGSRVLDFGCGDGWFLQLARDAGLRGEGYEFQSDHARRLSAHVGVPITSDLGRLSQGSTGAFDAITLHSVLEHVPDPCGTIATLANLLAAGGSMYIVVPNLESWEARLFRSKWHGLDPPRHISFPGPEVIGRIAQASNLVVEKVRPVPFPTTSAASLVSVVAGRYIHWLFLMAMPAGIVLSLIAPSGSLSYLLRKPAYAI